MPAPAASGTMIVIGLDGNSCALPGPGAIKAAEMMVATKTARMDALMMGLMVPSPLLAGPCGPPE